MHSPTRRSISLSAAGLLLVLALAGLGWLMPLATHGEDAPAEARELLVSLGPDNRLLPLRVSENSFEARLDIDGSGAEPVLQPWRYNIYAQFYFPQEDPQIDYTFLGNRRYPRLLLKLDRQAALLWVNTAATRADAEQLREELSRQGLEGAFVARSRGDYGYQHSPAQLARLEELARRLDRSQCGAEDPLDWLTAKDLQRRFSMQVRLLYIDGLSGVNEALELHDRVTSELGQCGMLNRPGGGYRLFCGAYESKAKLQADYGKLAALSGIKPTVICLNANGQSTGWAEEDPSGW